MGKNRGADRTKGNIQPSSSGRSAELLGNVSGFVGFGGLKDLGYVPAVTQSSVEDDSQISAELRVTLRKMSKKDTVTKIKALQEFQSLCTSESNDSVKSVLPFWPRLYCKLVLDNERRIRESTHTANKTLIQQIGKHLAPHLRSIMPSWLISMTDPHQAAAVAATNAFENAFSEEKRPEVLVFCLKEIINFISDNLFFQTSQTLSDPKTTAKEERESKYLRVLICSLKGLCLFLELTKNEQTKKSEIVDCVSSVIDHEKFWALAKHPNSQIRCSWFDSIKILCEFDVHLLQNHSSRLAELLFSSLDHPDSIVLPHIWVAFISMCVWLPKCWDYCENVHTVHNCINSVLKDGARGCATDLAPHYLAILSTISKSSMENKNTFYINFFDAISSSLCKEKVLSNSRDTFVLNIALHECLKFVSKIESNNRDLWETLIRCQVLQLLKNAFTVTPQLGESNYFHEVSKLLAFFSKNVSKDIVSLDKGVIFWSLFIPECQSWIQEMDSEKINKIKFFFQILTEPNSLRLVKRKSVRFTSEKVTDGELLENKETSLKMSLYSKDLVPIMDTCLQTFHVTRSESVFELFTYLLISCSLEDENYRLFCHEPFENVSKSKKLFLELVVLPIVDSDNSEALIIENAADIFFHVYAQLDTECQEVLMQNTKLTMKTKGLQTLISRMADRAHEDSVAAKWLKSSPLGCRLVKCLQQLCAISLSKDSFDSPVVKLEHDELQELLIFVFNNADKEECIFSLEYLGQMFKFLFAALNQQSEDKLTNERSESILLNWILLFVKTHLKIFTNFKIPGTYELLKSLFDRIFPTRLLDQKRSEDAQDCILAALNLTINCPLINENELLVHILKKSKDIIFSHSCSFDVIFKLITLLKSVFGIIAKRDDCANDDGILYSRVINLAWSLLLPSTKEWNKIETSLSSQYILNSAMSGILLCTSLPTLERKSSLNWDVTYLKVCLVGSQIITSLTSCDEYIDIKLQSEYTSFVASSLHAAIYSESIVSINKTLHHCEIDAKVNNAINELWSSLKTIIDKLKLHCKRDLVKYIGRKSASGRQDSWFVTLAKYGQDLIEDPSHASNIISKMDLQSQGYTQTKQAMLPYLSRAEVFDVLQSETKKLESLKDPLEALHSMCLVSTSLTLLPRDTDSAMKEGIQSAIHDCFAFIVRLRDVSANQFLFTNDIKNIKWEEGCFIISCMRLMTSIIRRHPLTLLHRHWDVTLCALSAWTQTIIESSLCPETDKMASLFLMSVSELTSVVAEVISEIKKDFVLRQEYPPTLMEEWEEFFAPNIFQTLLQQFIRCNGVYQNERDLLLYHVCRELALCVNNINKIAIDDLPLTPLFDASELESKSKLPEKMQTFMNHVCPILQSYHSTCQFSAYSVLNVSLPLWMNAWNQNQADVDDEDDLPQRPLPEALLSVIEQTGSLITVALSQVKFGCGCDIVPHTDTHTLTTGYLLAWMLLLKAVSLVQEQNQQLYFTFIRNVGILNTLLNNLFHLMPMNPSIPHEKTTMFSSECEEYPKEENSSETTTRLACYVYMQCLRQVPAAVRYWFSNLDRSSQQEVDQYTTTYVSPTILACEMNAINDPSAKLKNMTIKTRPYVREVVAVYTIDEASMELTLKMSPNHPLSIITVEDHKRVGVTVAEWRNWLLGLNRMLSHRNTPLLNSLEFWKKNVDQKFKGIEECYICYYVLHGTNHQMPKLLCRTCKKKFHSACLYKWFNTSNNSTCPLCRSLF